MKPNAIALGLNWQPTKQITITGTVADLTVDGNTFEPSVPRLVWDTVTKPAGIINRINITVSEGLTIMNNDVTESQWGIRVTGSTVTNKVVVVGNKVRESWEDAYQHGIGMGRFCWNTSDYKNAPPPEAGAHPDHFQWVNYEDGAVAIGNIGQVGAGENGAQGIFFADASVARTGIVIAGNVLFDTAPRGVSLDEADDPIIFGNGVLPTLDTASNASIIWEQNALNVGGTATKNVAKSLSFNSTATVTESVALPFADYAATFVNPVFTLVPGSAEWIAGWTPKAGSTVEGIWPVGSNYWDFTTRTITVPGFA